MAIPSEAKRVVHAWLCNGNTAHRSRGELFDRDLGTAPGGFSVHLLVTSLAHDPVQTWHFYSRTDTENRLKELKEDFGANGFCLTMGRKPLPF